MKKIILFLILTIFLSGCSLYSLNDFVLPDDAEFIVLIQELDTPLKISNYMIENFTYKKNTFGVISPYQLYIRRVGDCTDFANFAQCCANYHDYLTYQLVIFYNGFSHQIAVYSEYNCYSMTDNQYYYCCFLNFIDIVNFDSAGRNINWISYKVYDYDMNLIEKIYASL